MRMPMSKDKKIFPSRMAGAKYCRVAHAYPGHHPAWRYSFLYGAEAHSDDALKRGVPICTRSPLPRSKRQFSDHAEENQVHAEKLRRLNYKALMLRLPQTVLTRCVCARVHELARTSPRTHEPAHARARARTSALACARASARARKLSFLIPVN